MTRCMHGPEALVKCSLDNLWTDVPDKEDFDLEKWNEMLWSRMVPASSSRTDWGTTCLMSPFALLVAPLPLMHMREKGRLCMVLLRTAESVQEHPSKQSRCPMHANCSPVN